MQSTEEGSSSDELDAQDHLRRTAKRSNFNCNQTATLSAYYQSGMRGVGKQYAILIARAAAETKLSREQVKVYA